MTNVIAFRSTAVSDDAQVVLDGLGYDIQNHIATHRPTLIGLADVLTGIVDNPGPTPGRDLIAALQGPAPHFAGVLLIDHGVGILDSDLDDPNLLAAVHTAAHQVTRWLDQLLELRLNDVVPVPDLDEEGVAS